MEKLADAKKSLNYYASTEKAQVLRSFFKTGKGEYGEGDIFIGVTVPQIRMVAKHFAELGQKDILKLLHSKIHEERELALFIWVSQYQKGDTALRQKIFQAYLGHTEFINNWDLVDLSAPKIIGDFLLDKKRDILYALAQSPLLWDRRIAVVATLAFIRAGQFDEPIRLAENLMNDKEALMHKACGWMLREVGKRDAAVLRAFLKKHSRVMPRTMLRYAIEKFDRQERYAYLADGAKSIIYGKDK